MYGAQVKFSAVGETTVPATRYLLIMSPREGAMIVEPHWEWILEHEDMIRGMLRRACRGRYDLLDDLWSDVVVTRCEAIMLTYNSNHTSHASLKTHMMVNLQRYTWKWMNTLGRPYRERGYERVPEYFDVAITESLKLDNVDEVKTIMVQLDEYDRRLLEMKHIHDMTFLEMADVIGVSAKTTARNHYRVALARAQEMAAARPR